jgi:hypothetical protein
VVAFPQSNVRMVPASERLYAAVKEGTLTHPNDPDLHRHMAASSPARPSTVPGSTSSARVSRSTPPWRWRWPSTALRPPLPHPPTCSGGCDRVLQDDDDQDDQQN